MSYQARLDAIESQIHDLKIAIKNIQSELSNLRSRYNSLDSQQSELIKKSKLHGDMLSRMRTDI